MSETNKNNATIKAEIKNGYFTGNYATIGGNESWTEVDALPEDNGLLRLTCYRYENSEWIFDEDKYQAALTEQQTEKFAAMKQEMISTSKTNLAKYLSGYKLASSCHGGVEKLYSVTSEKQQYLASVILTASMARQAGMPYQPSWNAAGEECTPDWTIEELQQLAFEIEAVVRPLISKQQAMEVSIMEASTLEELHAVEITF